MRLRNSNWLKVAVAVTACVVLLAGDMALASNMGFKMNKVISPFADATRENWVALPYRHPYVGMQDVCAALGLTPNNAASKIRRIDPQTGITTSWDCGAVGNSPCLQNAGGSCSGTPAEHVKRAGLIVTNNVAAGGVLVGSHQSNPPGSITLKPRGGSPIGDNYFSVPYHTTDVTFQDLCVDLALPGTSGAANGKVERRNAATGATTSWDCQAIGTAPSLILGEAVRVTFTGAGDIVVAAGHPAHF